MPKQILLVEDSLTMQKVVEITFAHEDYRITSAKETEEALVRVRDIRPDVVLADAGLAGRSGYDLCAMLKSDPVLRDVPVVLLTSNFNPYDDARGQKAGVDAHVVKPFETQVLIDKVADLIRRRGASGLSQGATTMVSMPPLHPTSGVAPVGMVAQTGSDPRRPTVPPMAPQRGQYPTPAADPGIQRSTLMGIPAVNPMGPSGLRPPPPPGMRVRETGNLPAINPPQIPPPSMGPPMPSWSARPDVRSPDVRSQELRPQEPARPMPTYAENVPSGRSPQPTGQNTGQPTGQAATAATLPAGIPATVPQMPRPPLLPRAPVPAPVLAALERIAQRGAEYEAVARMSLETVEQIAWEVIPELAEAMIRAELERLIKEREQKAP